MRLFSALIIGVAALVVSIGVLETSTALAHTSPEMTHVISQRELKGREVPIGLDRSLLVQASVPLTDPDLDIFLDCDNCPDGVVIDGNADYSWNASGQGRVRRNRGPFKGQGELKSTGDANIVYAFTFKKIDRTFRDANGAAVGVVLSGQAQVTDSQGTEKFRIKAAITPAPEAPERLIWDIRGPGLSLQFEANGRLRSSER